LLGSVAMINWKIGCSGYYYPEWKGFFYPLDLPKSQWFEHYCDHFNAIELNGTFYKFPRIDSLSNWYRRSPMDFRFSVKAPRVITHFKRMKDSAKYLRDFYNVVRDGLAEKAGCLLFQFPSAYQASDEAVDRLLSMLDRTFVNVVEFRHASWWDERITSTLHKEGIVMSGVSHPQFPSAVVGDGPIMYYRLHGVPHLYHSSYDPSSLEDITLQAQQITPLKEAYIVFNNTASGAALQNAKQLVELTAAIAT
jgi:uncharacterized protein YecE (DUF72 family)